MKLSKAPTILTIVPALLFSDTNKLVASSHNEYRSRIWEHLKDEPKSVTLQEEIGLFKEQLGGRIKKSDIDGEPLSFSLNGEKFFLKLSYDVQKKEFTYNGLLFLGNGAGRVPKEDFPEIHKRIQAEIEKLKDWKGWEKEKAQ